MYLWAQPRHQYDVRAHGRLNHQRPPPRRHLCRLGHDPQRPGHPGERGRHRALLPVRGGRAERGQMLQQVLRKVPRQPVAIGDDRAGPTHRQLRPGDDDDEYINDWVWKLEKEID